MQAVYVVLQVVYVVLKAVYVVLQAVHVVLKAVYVVLQAVYVVLLAVYVELRRDVANLPSLSSDELWFFRMFQYVGSFQVCGDDQAKRADYCREKVFHLKVSIYS